MGILFLSLPAEKSDSKFSMGYLHGEYECTLDAKGRLMLPAALKKQFPKQAKVKLFIKRGFEKCLILYTKNEWDLIAESVNRLSDFVKNNRDFKRYFFQGATELTMDSVARILIPMQLQDYAALKTDIVLFAHSNQIEIWDKKEHAKMLKNEPQDFSALAEDVMVKNKQLKD